MKKIKGSFLFKIKGSDGKVQEWLVDLKSAPGSVTKGSGTASSLGAKYPFSIYIIFTGLKGNCTLSMKDSDFMDLVTGKLGAQKVRFYPIVKGYKQREGERGGIE